MYSLYYSKKEKVIEIKKAKKVLQKLEYTDEVTRYNDCYYICSKRSPLVEKAKEIHGEWVAEIEQELRALRSIEIK
ncbi:hypothetical protein [Paenibacillus campinasensis]|uniref:Uncharacterized protein n=1 Tax=Paenibacillus campinasensis TaxID=66347 RepID=A0A268EI69_9BACL|nr:hypothetical protein [Paenibacillus campinasensis]PAD72820.1 hypothetical protein CHH67_21160 [Paenibacillus campinasensis]